MRLLAVLSALASVAVLAAAPAGADSAPVGPLPKGPVSTLTTTRGSLIAIALPAQKPSTGLVWRAARHVDPKVARQVWEADVGESVVVVFRAIARGTVRIVFAATKSDASPKAVKAQTTVVHIR